MQIKPHQAKHISEQQRRFRQAISDCQFDTYTFVGYYTSKINDFERDLSKDKYSTHVKYLHYHSSINSTSGNGVD